MNVSYLIFTALIFMFFFGIGYYPPKNKESLAYMFGTIVLIVLIAFVMFGGR